MKTYLLICFLLLFYSINSKTLRECQTSYMNCLKNNYQSYPKNSPSYKNSISLCRRIFYHCMDN